MKRPRSRFLPRAARCSAAVSFARLRMGRLMPVRPWWKPAGSAIAAAPSPRTGRFAFLTTVRKPFVFSRYRSCCRLAAPAAAQMAGSVSVDSDYRFRGYSLSMESLSRARNSRTTKVGNLSQRRDNRRRTESGSVHFLGYQANLGYARRISSSVSVDAGVAHSLYRYRFTTSIIGGYDEAYLGLNAHNISASLIISSAALFAHRTFHDFLWRARGRFQPARSGRRQRPVGALKYLTTPNNDFRHDHSGSTGAPRRPVNSAGRATRPALSGRKPATAIHMTSGKTDGLTAGQV